MADTKPEAEALRRTPEPENAAIPAAHWSDLWEYHLAMGGEGEHALNWADKPHRLVYDLTKMVADLRAALSKPVLTMTREEAARLLDPHRYSSDRAEVERVWETIIAAMTAQPKPSVAPSDEALVNDVRKEHVAMMAGDGSPFKFDAACNAVLRIISEYKTRAETAEAALAACRDKTIEECAAVAAPYPQTGFPIMPAERLVNREREIITASIRALKKEPTNG